MAKEKTYKIVQEHEKCIGCGACVSVCENWVLDNNCKAKPKKIIINEREVKCNRDAEKICPVNCIHVK